MEIPSVLISDTNGSLASDLFKIHVDSPVISARLTDEVSKSRMLTVALDNVRLDSVPNIHTSTYKTFLAYNGTLGYSNKVFTTVVKESAGIFDVSNFPVLSYDPGTLVRPNVTDLEDVVIDIKLYNGTVDVLRYAQGELNNGEKTYYVKEARAYPTQITGMPNMEGNKVTMDGWYSYTTVIFRNISEGATVVKDNFYALSGFIFKATHDGQIYKDLLKGTVVVLRPGDNTLAAAAVQPKNEDYAQILFSLNETTGTSAQGNNIFIHSQILVTDQIRDAITAEAVTAAFADPEDYVDFQNWQKLTMKRMAAAIMFQNGLFENAQIILESARELCSPGKYNSNC
jgi:hypothetical protein